MDGADAHDWRPDKCLGQGFASLQRLRFQSHRFRRLWRELAAKLQRPRALLRPSGIVRRRVRAGRGSRGTAGWQVPTADATYMPGNADANSRKAETGLDSHARAVG